MPLVSCDVALAEDDDDDDFELLFFDDVVEAGALSEFMHSSRSFRRHISLYADDIELSVFAMRFL